MISRGKALITKADNERLIGTIALVVSNRSIIVAARDTGISTAAGIRKNLVQLFSTGSFRIREGNRPKLDSSRLVSPVVFRKKGRVEASMIDSPSPRLAETGKF